jgi:general secretion pathway protein G
MLVTLTILSVLVLAVAPVAQMTARRAKERELKAALSEIRHGLDAYKRAYDEKRLPQRPDASGYPPSLDALVEATPDLLNPQGPPLRFLRRVPRDPFMGPASARAEWGLRSYASPPQRPAPGVDVFDVYSLSDEVGLNGLAYREW